MLELWMIKEELIMKMASIFEQTQELPHIPRVVQELMQSFQDDDIDVDEISKKVAMDQALTAKVLRLANSAHYGASRSIANTNDAIVVLGFNTLRTMVLASGVTSSFKSPEGFDMNGFWKQSFAIGALSKWIANYIPNCEAETAFTCGMLNSIGSLLIRIVLPSEAKSIDEAEILGGKRYSLERGQLGFDGAKVGAELAKRWKFPDEMQAAIRDQNNVDFDQEYGLYAGILYIAKYLHHAHKEDWDEARIIDEFPLAAAQVIGMDTEKAYLDVASTTDLETGLDSLLDD
jgi:HD-like signal output (HDOD) protein